MRRRSWPFKRNSARSTSTFGGFVGHEPKQNAWKSIKEVPAKTPESDAMSKDLKRRGFKFVGNTICYAFMQAVGMVNDHLVECYRHAELSQPGERHG